MSDRTERALRDLQNRVDTLETVVVRSWCLGVAVLLGAGVLVPYAYDDVSDEEPVGWSVATTPFLASGSGDGDAGTGDSLQAPFVIGFLGLLVVVLALVVGLFTIAGRQASERAAKVLRVLLVLAGIGTGVVALLSLVAAGNDGAGPGALVLLAGVIAYGTLLARGARSLWLERPHPLPPPPARTANRTAREDAAS